MAAAEPSQETLDTLVQVALDERALGYQALDALDTKAGILLAVDGLLIAAASQTENPWIRALVVVLFAAAAVPALWSIAVRRYQQIPVKPLTDHYLNATPTQVRMQVLAELANHEADFDAKRDRAADLVIAAFWLTALAIAVLVATTFIPA